MLLMLQTLIMGNRDVIDEMSSTNAAVLASILKLIDKYDLYGLVSYPKHHKQSDVPDIYRLAARTKVCYMLFVLLQFSNKFFFKIVLVSFFFVLFFMHNKLSFLLQQG